MGKGKKRKGGRKNGGGTPPTMAQPPRPTSSGEPSPAPVRAEAPAGSLPSPHEVPKPPVPAGSPPSGEREGASPRRRPAEAEQREKELEAENARLREDLEGLRLDATAGFVATRRRLREEFERELEERRAKLEEERRASETERSAWLEERTESHRRDGERRHAAEEKLTAELEARRVAFEKAHEAKRVELENREEKLAAAAGELRKARKKLSLDAEILEEDRASLIDASEAKTARRIEEMEGRVRTLEARLEAVRAERDGFESELEARRERERRHEGRSLEELVSEIDGLRGERRRLEEELATRPRAELVVEAEALRGKLAEAEERREGDLREMAQLRCRLDRHLSLVTERESLRDRNALLEAELRVMAEACKKRREELENLVRGSDGASPFPSCVKMDADPALRRAKGLGKRPSDLKILVDYLRDRMAARHRVDERRYYATRDLRAFLGGMAMSRLHLLQGISGTGKTSLPIHLAQALGAEHALIEVQAGWRDRQDLIGHYNTFEKRYHETEFLQALYRAGRPANADRPFFVVLDEMNLSHPEQYFADFLSALEQEEGAQVLDLMTAEVAGAPEGFVEGRRLPIPPNVWFVGTANHDETTMNFADKTTDRAHVQELPRNPETFTAKAPDVDFIPLALGELTALFGEARTRHEKKASKAYDWLCQSLEEELGAHFAIGWGNRLRRQVGRFVPVVVAAGGSVAEAMDHILASKILKKLCGRHDNRREELVALKEILVGSWSDLDPSESAERSLALIDEEIRRVGVGYV